MHLSQPTVRITHKYFPHLAIHEEENVDARLLIEPLLIEPPSQGLFCTPLFSSPLVVARILRPRPARQNAESIAFGATFQSGSQFARISKFARIGDQSKDGNGEGEEGGRAAGMSSWGDMPKFLLAGSVSTIISRTCVAPLERIKLECIIRRSPVSWMNVIRHILVSEGIKGFWKGNLINLFRMIPFKSINFICYDLYLDWLHRIPGKREITNHDRLIGGGLSGVIATLLCLPLDTIRTRLVAPGGEVLGGVTGCFAHMVRNEGFLSLYKGLTPALISMGPASAVFYAVYDILKTSHLSSRRSRSRSPSGEEAELGPVRTLLYGAFAGACAETVTYPLEVIRRQLQLEQAANVGLIATFIKVIERDGIGSLFTGLAPSTLQVLPSASLSYFFYEMMKSMLKIS